MRELGGCVGRERGRVGVCAAGSGADLLSGGRGRISGREDGEGWSYLNVCCKRKLGFESAELGAQF